MLRHRRAQHVVHAEERIEKIAAVQQHHRIVPDGRHGEEKGEAREDMEAQELAQAALPGEEEQDDEARQADADGPFREHRDAREEEREVVPAYAPLLIAEEKGNERAAHSDEKRRVGDHRVADIPELDRCAHEQRRDEADALPVEPAPEPVCEQQTDCRKERREKPRRKLRLTEERKRRDELPVKKHGLVIPVVTVDARRNQVARRHHLLGRFHIVRFHGIRDGHRPVAHKVDEHGEEQQHRHMTPRAPLLSHRFPMSTKIIQPTHALTLP